MKRKHCDILILGAGCAGLTAGLYAARAGKRTVILERGIPGGQAAVTTRIENYPGIVHADGVTLMQTMAAQAKSAGAEIRCCEAEELDPEARTVITELGSFTFDALIAATGARPRKLDIPGEAEFTGRGVSYCASCDGFFYRDREIYVVGGGNSAAEESLHLAQLGSRVRMLVRRDRLSCEEHLAQKLRQEPKIELCFRRELAEIWGEDMLEGITVRDAVTGALTRQALPGGGVFIFAGYRPASELLAGKLSLDKDGYLLTDRQLQTSVPGIFGAGDVRQKSLRQIVTAVSDGAEAAFHACKFCTDVLS